MDCRLHVLRAGPLTTVQDRGRIGLAHLGVARAGPLDAPAAELANRLVGNRPDAALLEVTLGGLVARLSGQRPGAWVGVTGAGTPATVDGVAVAHSTAVWLPTGARLDLGPPPVGVRSYVAVGGGIDVEPVLGSRATDTLAWVGPPRVRDGDRLPVGGAVRAPRPLDTPPVPRPGPLRLLPGPRDDWFVDGAVAGLCAAAYAVDPASDRIGLRLQGPVVARRPGVPAELPSEGMVLGAVQVPPSGQPVVLLADHPPTGGYPVVGVVDPDDLWRCAQLRPGDRVGFRLSSLRGA